MRNLHRAVHVALLCLLLSIPGPAGGRASEVEIPSGPRVISLGYMKGVFLGLEEEEAKNVLKIWVDRVYGPNFPDCVTRIGIVDDIAEMERAIQGKKVDVISTLSDDFVRLRDSAPIRPVMLVARGGSVYQEMVLLVRRDSGLRQLKDLHRKKAVLTGEEGRMIHMLWLETMLMREGYRTSRDFFSSVREVSKPSQAILSVFFGQSDACLASRFAFDLATELNPQIGREMVVLAKSAGMAIGVVSVRSDFEPKKRDTLIASLESMEASPAGRQLLNIFRMDRFVPFREEYVAPVEALVKEHARLREKLTGRH